MWPAKKKDIEELHHYLKNSFQGVREDTQNINAWIQHFHQKNQQQENTISQLHQKNSQLETYLQQLHFYLHQLQSQKEDPRLLSHLQQRIEQLNQKVDHLLTTRQQHSQHLQSLHATHQLHSQQLGTHSQKLDSFHQHISLHSQKIDTFHQKLQEIEALKPPQKSTFKEKIVQTFSRHSKNYLKNLIFQYLEQHQKLSALQLKDMVVDQQGLASKSSFYRILQEIEDSDQLTVIKDGKQKIFLLKNATTL